MELIPILSMIILVATISTFILAIGSYFLYKVRERKSQYATTFRPSVYQAEILSPEISHAEMQHGQFQPYTDVRPAYMQEGYNPVNETQYRPEPSPAAFTPQPRQFSATETSKQRARATEDNKYLKYTSEGYVPPASDKKSGTAKWK